MVEVERLSHFFGPRQALREVSFSLEKGGFLFLTGPSGAGKTTLLRLLHGSLPVTRGRAVVAGFDLGRMPRRRIPELRREVGVVFQDFKILPERTAAENVRLALDVRGVDRGTALRRVLAILGAVGLAGMEDAPCGLLSGGEQQRVAIARSMVSNPKLILADEPTGNLDQDLALRLLEVFRQFNTHGTTIIMATHNREMLARVPEAAVVRLRPGLAGEADGLPGAGEAQTAEADRPGPGSPGRETAEPAWSGGSGAEGGA